MKIVSLLRALAIAACLALAAPAWGAEAVPQAPSKAGLKEAQALFKAGRFEDALAVLRPLAAAQPRQMDIRFFIGMAAIGAAQTPGVPEERRDAVLDEAIAAFRAMLVRRPELVRVRLELARAFFLKGEDKLARRHFEQVLAGKPPAAVALNVNRFLNIMRARKRWSLRLGAAFLPDTNLGTSSAERTILLDTPFGRLPFTLDNYNAPKSGIGISAWVGGEYQYPLAGRWRLRAGGDFSRKGYRESAFDTMTLSGHVGPRWLVGRASEASLLVSGVHHWTGSGLEEPSHHDIGARVEGRHRFDRRTTVNARLAQHERRYDKRTHLDGPVTDVSVGVGWVASPTMRVDAGVGWGKERPRAPFQPLGAARGHGAAPLGLHRGRLGQAALGRLRGRLVPFTEPGQSRSDITRTIRLFAHNRALTLEGFSPQVSVTQEQRTTNAQLHDYERIFGELRFVRLF